MISKKLIPYQNSDSNKLDDFFRSVLNILYLRKKHTLFFGLIQLFLSFFSIIGSTYLMNNSVARR
jgi:hypothetical protein